MADATKLVSVQALDRAAKAYRTLFLAMADEERDFMLEGVDLREASARRPLLFPNRKLATTTTELLKQLTWLAENGGRCEVERYLCYVQVRHFFETATQ